MTISITLSLALANDIIEAVDSTIDNLLSEYENYDCDAMLAARDAIYAALEISNTETIDLNRAALIEAVGPFADDDTIDEVLEREGMCERLTALYVSLELDAAHVAVN